jgi:chlorite dismutase
MDTPETTHIFMLLKTTPAWLQLPPADRYGFLGTHIMPILKRYPEVRLRFFDTEFHSADITDIALWETTNLAAWRGLVDDLRETLFWDSYFQVLHLLTGIENGHMAHYGELARAALEG